MTRVSQAYNTLWGTGIIFVILPHLNLGLLSDYKICGDSECESPVSRVVAIRDHHGKDCRFLSFRRGDTIFVYHKLTGKREDLWAGSIDKEFGYFPKDAVQEKHVHTTVEKVMETQESDFFCMDEFGYPIESSHLDSDDDEKIQNQESETTPYTNVESPQTSEDISTRSPVPAKETDPTSTAEDENKSTADSSARAHEETQEAPAALKEQGGSAPSAWFGSSVTGWLGLSTVEEPGNLAEGQAEEQPDDAKKSREEERESVDSFTSTVTRWLGFGGEKRTDHSAEKEQDGQTENDEEEEPAEKFRSRRMSLNLEGSQLHEEEKEEMGTLDWLTKGLSNQLGFSLTNQPSGHETATERENKEAIQVVEEQPASSSWFDMGLTDILGFRRDNSEVDESTKSDFDEQEKDEISELTGSVSQSQAALTEEGNTEISNEPKVEETLKDQNDPSEVETVPSYVKSNKSNIGMSDSSKNSVSPEDTAFEDSQKDIYPQNKSEEKSQTVGGLSSVLSSFFQIGGDIEEEHDVLDDNKKETNTPDRETSAEMEDKDQLPKSAENMCEVNNNTERGEEMKTTDEAFLTQSDINFAPDFSSVVLNSNSGGQSVGDEGQTEDGVEKMSEISNQIDKREESTDKGKGSYAESGAFQKEVSTTQTDDVAERSHVAGGVQESRVENEVFLSSGTTVDRNEPAPNEDDTPAHSEDTSVHQLDPLVMIDNNTEAETHRGGLGQEGEGHPVEGSSPEFGSSRSTNRNTEIIAEEASEETRRTFYPSESSTMSADDVNQDSTHMQKTDTESQNKLQPVQTETTRFEKLVVKENQSYVQSDIGSETETEDVDEFKKKEKQAETEEYKEEEEEVVEAPGKQHERDEEKQEEAEELKEEEKQQVVKESEENEKQEEIEEVREGKQEEVGDLKEEERQQVVKESEEDGKQEEIEEVKEEKQEEAGELKKEERQQVVKESEEDGKQDEIEVVKEEKQGLVGVIKEKTQEEVEKITEEEKQQEEEVEEVEGKNNHEELEKERENPAVKELKEYKERVEEEELREDEKQQQIEELEEEKQEGVEEERMEELKEVEEVKVEEKKVSENKLVQSSHFKVEMENRPHASLDHQKDIDSNEGETEGENSFQSETSARNKKQEEEAMEKIKEKGAGDNVEVEWRNKEEEEERHLKCSNEPFLQACEDRFLRERDGDDCANRGEAEPETEKQHPMAESDQILAERTAGGQTVPSEGMEGKDAEADDEKEKLSEKNSELNTAGNEDIKTNNDIISDLGVKQIRKRGYADNDLLSSGESSHSSNRTLPGPRAENKEELYSKEAKNTNLSDDKVFHQGDKTEPEGTEASSSGTSTATYEDTNQEEMEVNMKHDDARVNEEAGAQMTKSEAVISEQPNPLVSQRLSDGHTNSIAETGGGGVFGLFQNTFSFFTQTPTTESTERSPSVDAEEGETPTDHSSLTPDQDLDSTTDSAQVYSHDPPTTLSQRHLSHPSSVSPNAGGPLLSKHHKSLLAYMSVDEKNSLMELFGRHKLQFLDYILGSSETMTDAPDNDESLLSDIERLLRYHRETLASHGTRLVNAQEERDKSRTLITLQKLEMLLARVRETFETRKLLISNTNHQAEAGCFSESCSAHSKDKEMAAEEGSSKMGESSNLLHANTPRDDWMRMDKEKGGHPNGGMGKERVTEDGEGVEGDIRSQEERVSTESCPHVQPGPPQPLEGVMEQIVDVVHQIAEDSTTHVHAVEKLFIWLIIQVYNPMLNLRDNVMFKRGAPSVQK